VKSHLSSDPAVVTVPLSRLRHLQQLAPLAASTLAVLSLQGPASAQSMGEGTATLVSPGALAPGEANPGRLSAKSSSPNRAESATAPNPFAHRCSAFLNTLDTLQN